MRKKKLIYHSDFPGAFTGFGRATKEVLTYLHKTGKYEIINLCCGMIKDHPDLDKTPWKSIGILPNTQAEINQLSNDPSKHRKASYGVFAIDKIIEEEKPDVWIGVQDPWAFVGFYKKEWFKYLNTVIWTTIDSRPILPEILNQAAHFANYWVWADFATKELHAKGFSQVNTVRGPINTKNFYKLSNKRKQELREKNNIEKDDYIIGFVFRNQLRKLVPNLLKGYSLWKKQKGIKNSKLLLHTSFDIQDQHIGKMYEVKV